VPIVRWLDAVGLKEAMALTMALGVACASNVAPRKPSAAGRPARPPAPSASVGEVETGTASWYGPGFHGKRTACGEAFDQDALTAAHRTYTCGARVRVTLIATGKSVLVRVNDRLPPGKGRLIDLSRGAAKAIGLIGPGIGAVRVEVIEAALRRP
jgi:rare lipoprotein A